MSDVPNGGGAFPPPTREVLIRIFWALADTLLIVVAVFAAAWLRYDLEVSPAFRPSIRGFALTLGIVFLVVGLIHTLPSRRHPRGTFEEAAQVLRIAGVTFVFGLVAVFLTPWFRVPRSLPFIAPALGVLGMFALRFVIRTYRWAPRSAMERSRPVIVYGAGEGGRSLIRALHRDQSSGERLEPVALLDDDPRTHRWRIDGLRVSGGFDQMAAAAEQTGARILAVAIPSIGTIRLREIQDHAQSLGLEVLVLPTAPQLLGLPGATDLRRIQPEDLLGRHPVALQTEGVAELLTGRRVLVTGAGGALGAELCRQVARFGPATMILLDQDEAALHQTETMLTGRDPSLSVSIALCDIRHADAVRKVFATERPDVVFHGAKLSHGSLLNRFPLEAYKTNVMGTINTLEAAGRARVSVFVNLSSDKAARPDSVLGWSERIAERLTAGAARAKGGRVFSVRLGPVLGTRASLVNAMVGQIEQGGPVTISHPDEQAHFLFISEACQLVLQAAVLGVDGESMILDMGQPRRVLDVAKSLISRSGKVGVRIDFTGPESGANLSQSLVAENEVVQETGHELVTRVWVPPLDVHSVRYRELDDPESAREWMRREGSTFDEQGLFDIAGRDDHHSAGERIFLSRADVTEVEESLVLEALRSGWVAPLGPMVDRFERLIAERAGVSSALALSSGTAALHLALLEAGARPGRAVVVSSMTFAASANAVLYTGAEPVFVDSQLDDGNVDVHLMLEAVRTLLTEGVDVAAVMAVDLFGRCVDYTTLQAGLDVLGVPLIEDAAESLGAMHQGRSAGSFGAAAAFSFNGNKIMTTSGGGMLVSNDDDLVGRARYLSTQARQPAPWYEHTEMGFNYRLSNLLAALGVGQLSRLDAIISRRRAIRARYTEGLGGVDGLAFLGPPLTDEVEDNCWLTCITLDPDVTGVSATTVIDGLSAANIEARHLWKPMHLQPMYDGRRSFLNGNSERLFSTGVTLPSGSELTDTHIDRVIDTLLRVLKDRA